MSDIGDLLTHYNINIPSQIPGRYTTTCPWCSASRKPNHRRLNVLGVTITNDGRLYFGCNHCHITGPTRGVRDELPHYDYPNDTRKTRVNGQFAWEHRGSNGDWVNGSGGAITKLYRIDEAIEAGGTVLVAEGEKDVDNLWTIGFPAVCHPHGAGNWTEAHSAQLAGLTIVVLNDNDEPGYKYAAAVVKHSIGVAKSVRRLDLKDYWPEIAAGEDVSDWLDHGGGSEGQLESILAELPEINGHDERQEPKPAGLPIANIAPWDLLPLPEQHWIVLNRIPAHEVFILSGEGGAGKSTVALHLCAATVLARDWLGSMPEPGPALFIDAEDHIDVIHRRLFAVKEHYHTSFAELASGGLHIVSLHGKDAVLATTTPRSGILQLTPLHDELLNVVRRIKPKITVLSSLANFYAASEIDRFAVRQFMSALIQVAVAADGAVVLISHPSLTGMSNGSSLSGSTAWHNSARGRAALTGTKEDDQGSDYRLLEFKKNQYGPPDEAHTLKWRDGMFMAESSGATDYEKAAKLARAETVFLELLRAFLDQGRNLSHKSSSANYAPKVFSAQEKAAGIGAKDLAKTMDRLLSDKKIKVAQYGPPSRGWDRLEPV
jgi:RecA-family ATPase